MAQIMVVEDESIIGMQLQQQLTKLGYTVAGIVTSGKEALAKVAELQPDLVLMDVHIEGELDGIETAARLPASLEIPVVFITGYSEDTTLTRARSTKPYGYLVKPFTARELHATIQMTLERRAAYVSVRESEQRLRLALDASDKAAHELAQTNDRLQAEIDERRTLERKNAEMERFCYTISHDLKAPLVTICGFANLIRQDAMSGSLQQLSEDIEEIARAAQSLQRMLDDLLELSSNGQVADTGQEVPLAQVVRHSLGLLKTKLEDNNAAVEVAGDWPVVCGDYGRLVAVFQNLIDNAIKYRGDQENLRIEIGVSVADGRAVCSVQDNGRGIDTRYHERVFGLFVRLEAEIEGKGIGLALVKRVIDAHGGRIWLESEGEGRGCKFSFTLPVAPARAH